MLARRRFLVTVGLVAVGATGGGWTLSACDADPLSPGADISSPPDRADLPRPPVVSSHDGRLAVTLTAAPGVLLAGRRTSALGFNGTSPGPTLQVRPGDELAVRLVNSLDAPTNLHTHGLRVAPGGNGDNPFVRVEPGKSFDYAISIPADHPPGTHWYHPHLHHLVADQLYGGLMGALVVAGPDEVQVDDDRVVMLSDITLAPAGSVVPPTAMERVLGREGNLLLVNGADLPVVRMVPGSRERWRIVNACTSRIVELHLEGHRMTQIAVDGSYLPAPLARERVRLAPGNRVDVLVEPAGTGRFSLLADTLDRGGMGMMRAGNAGRRAIATVTCEGAPAGPGRAPLPTHLPAETSARGPVTAYRRLDLQMGMGMGMGMGGMARGTGVSATIDGRSFDPARDDQTTVIGNVEEWTMVNSSTMVHPFHLHAWPFTVLASSDGATPAGVPQDVVEVPPRGWVRLYVPFTAVSGRSVYHCHVLDHEDAGMMGTVNVRPGT